jgi:hypothetical protein
MDAELQDSAHWGICRLLSATEDEFMSDTARTDCVPAAADAAYSRTLTSYAMNGLDFAGVPLLYGPLLNRPLLPGRSGLPLL